MGYIKSEAAKITHQLRFSMPFVVQAHMKAQSGWEMLRGPIYSDISKGIITATWEIISGMGMVIEVDRTGVNACSIRAKND